jgi:hypothetical protein
MTSAHPMGEYVEPAVDRTSRLEPEPKPAVVAEAEASWLSSSYDLLTGLVVRDVTDTIPGDVFEGVFRFDDRPVRRSPSVARTA